MCKPIPAPRRLLNGPCQPANAESVRPIPAPRNATCSQPSIAEASQNSPSSSFDLQQVLQPSAPQPECSSSSNACSAIVTVMKTVRDKPCIGYQGFSYRFAKRGKLIIMNYHCFQRLCSDFCLQYIYPYIQNFFLVSMYMYMLMYMLSFWNGFRWYSLPPPRCKSLFIICIMCLVTGADDSLYFRCTIKSCVGQIRTNEDYSNVEVRNNKHHHLPYPEAIKVRDVIHKVREEVKQPTDPIGAIYRRCTATVASDLCQRHRRQLFPRSTAACIINVIAWCRLFLKPVQQWLSLTYTDNATTFPL